MYLFRCKYLHFIYYSASDVHTLLWGGFQDILQELMEAEPDATLGREKNNKGDAETSKRCNSPSS